MQEGQHDQVGASLGSAQTNAVLKVTQPEPGERAEQPLRQRPWSHHCLQAVQVPALIHRSRL